MCGFNDLAAWGRSKYSERLLGLEHNGPMAGESFHLLFRDPFSLLLAATFPEPDQYR